MSSADATSRLAECGARLTDVRLRLVQAACAPGATVDGLLETIGAACDEIDAVVKAVGETSALAAWDDRSPSLSEAGEHSGEEGRNTRPCDSAEQPFRSTVEQTEVSHA